MKWQVVDPADMKKTFGSSEGAQAAIEIYEIDGEREYNVECYCGVCWEISNVGLDVFDQDKDREPGVYFVKHVVEAYGGEYDSWLEVNERDDDATV